jgi:2,3-bisphosphoglycerate-dependent phosphoglycerate mutase
VQLYFIRHGESQNNALYATTGRSLGRSQDPELTSTGHRQAELVAAYMRQPELYQPSDLYLSKLADPAQLPVPHDRLTHIYCSLMVRAVATADYIAEAVGIPATAFLDLHEGGGIFLELPQDDPESPHSTRYVPVGLPGNGRSFFEQRFPGLVLPQDLDESGWWNRPHEPMEARPQRAKCVLQNLLERHSRINPDGSEDRVALVSHGGFYNHFLRALLGLPPRGSDEGLADVWFAINNASITRIDCIDGHFTVLYTNDHQFLHPELVT